ncbi:MAG: dienelactone hydrolase family protein [Caldimonas sp.]
MRGAGDDPLPHPVLIRWAAWSGLPLDLQQAEALAANGYVVFAIDLYHGVVTTDAAKARRLKRNLPQGRAISEMKAVFDHLSTHPDVDATQVRAVGWSLVGRLALQLAIHEPRLAGCVVNYGALPTPTAELQSIEAPALGNFGALNRCVPAGKVRTFESDMSALGKSVDIKLYLGAGHSFENPANKRGYRAEAAADAWLRTLAFLASDARPEQKS